VCVSREKWRNLSEIGGASDFGAGANRASGPQAKVCSRLSYRSGENIL
jgi:hypothetical protein